MSYKIFTRGNYFYIVDSKGRERSGLSKDVRVTRSTTTDTDFYVTGVNDWKNNTVIPIADIQDSSGDGYTTSSFVTFYENNTGFSAAGGGSSATIIRSSDVTIDSSLANKNVLLTADFNKVVTCETSANVTLIEGQRTDFSWRNGGNVTFTAASGVTLKPAISKDAKIIELGIGAV